MWILQENPFHLQTLPCGVLNFSTLPSPIRLILWAVVGVETARINSIRQPLELASLEWRLMSVVPGEGFIFEKAPGIKMKIVLTQITVRNLAQPQGKGRVGVVPVRTHSHWGSLRSAKVCAGSAKRPAPGS